ncbi:SNase-domain-containing protein [Polychaeton citri CBS 116435]|uniref:Probable endonuclease LCL3 n=1 Tax=Polychaeton citri CBS 116435 TaxID=1314669 RepID=A0A9P4Q3L6_9PEZI|nr:SNase-domain-containing protein [Polychaeton citri CBS 116435]
MGLLDRVAGNEKDKGDTERQDGLLSSHNKTGSWEQNLNAVDWSHYTSTQTVTASIITTAAAFLLAHIYKTYIRRIPTVEYLKPSFLRRRSIYGYVSSVGDGDNFRLFHTPGGRMLGWSWLPGRQLGKMKKFQDKTIHVRIAGIDAPEMAHFGRPAQPHSQEALDWLRSSLLHRYVRAYPYRKDQYDRVVCTVYKRRWLFFKSDVGETMLRKGLATVYEAKFGSEFGGKEEQYKRAEKTAKLKKIGMWERPSLVGKMLGKADPKYESPREYKTRIAESEKTSGKKK